MKKKRHRTRQKKNTAILKFLIVLLVLALCGVGAMAAYSYNSYNNNNKEMQEAVTTDKIHKNIYINGVNVGGLSKEAAAMLLKKEFIPELQENTVTVVAEDHQLELSFGEFSARYDFSPAVDEAYQYGKQGSLLERYELVTALDVQPYTINYTPGYTYDRGNLIQYLTPLRDAINIEPLNASITRKDGQFILSGSQIGKVLNIDETAERIVEVLDSGESGTVVAVIDEIFPEYETDDFSDAQSLIGSYVTKVTPGDNGRNTNIKTALSKINDAVIYPGEIFSTNKYFGSMTYDNGYRMASVIVDGQLEDGMGGGVCQVSSTLYNAVLLAELDVVERRNHSMKVSYLDYGFDATLSGDYIDFKFKNDTDVPVFVEATLVNGTEVTVNLYGREVHDSGRTLKFEKQLIETVPPPETLETEDPTLALGERVVKTKPLTGQKYKVYKTVYDNGREVEKVLVNTSYYRPRREEILVGTGGAGAGTHVTAELPATVEGDPEADPAPLQPDDLDWLIGPEPTPYPMPLPIPDREDDQLITEPMG